MKLSIAGGHFLRQTLVFCAACSEVVRVDSQLVATGALLGRTLPPHLARVLGQGWNILTRCHLSISDSLRLKVQFGCLIQSATLAQVVHTLFTMSTWLMSNILHCIFCLRCSRLRGSYYFVPLEYSS